MQRVAGDRRAGTVEAQLAFARHVVDVSHADFADHGELVSPEGGTEQLGRRGLNLGNIKAFVAGQVDTGVNAKV